MVRVLEHGLYMSVDEVDVSHASIRCLCLHRGYCEHNSLANILVIFSVTTSFFQFHLFLKTVIFAYEKRVATG